MMFFIVFCVALLAIIQLAPDWEKTEFTLDLIGLLSLTVYFVGVYQIIP